MHYAWKRCAECPPNHCYSQLYACLYQHTALLGDRPWCAGRILHKRQHFLTAWRLPDVGLSEKGSNSQIFWPMTQSLRELCLKSEEEEPNRSSVTGSLFLFVKCERHYLSLKVATVPFKARKCRIFLNNASLRMRTWRTNRVILIPDSIFTL